MKNKTNECHTNCNIGCHGDNKNKKEVGLFTPGSGEKGPPILVKENGVMYPLNTISEFDVYGSLLEGICSGKNGTLTSTNFTPILRYFWKTDKPGLFTPVYPNRKIKRKVDKTINTNIK